MAMEILTVVQQTVAAWAQAGKNLADEQLIITGDSAQERVILDKLERIRRLQHQVEFAITDLEETETLA